MGVFLLFLCGATLVRGAEVTLWQIGEFNQSSEEFNGSFSVARSAQAAGLVYRVGQSDWKKDWPAFHPGSANGRAGAQEHPLTVVFTLDAPPRGVYTLRISVLTCMPRRPNLHLEVNGKRGLFYLRPQISYSLGESSAAFIPQFSQQQLDIELAAKYFLPGENRLVLTAVDEPVERDDSYATVAVGISGFFYDALRLTQDSARKFSWDEIQASVAPTVFYEQKDGQLLERVEALVRLNRKAAGRAQLELNGKGYTADLPAAGDFGEQLAEFLVPEWSGPAPARLRVQAGRARVFELTLEPQRKWTVFLVAHTHLDVGYTDYQGKVAEDQARVITQAADLIQRNPDFRFSIDGSWNFEQLSSTRSPERLDPIVELIRQGKMSVPAQYFCLLTGTAGLETLIRSFYPSKALARRYGFPFEYANITDVPSYSGSYPSMLASAGIKYFVAAGNNTRAPFLLYGRWNEKSPFWWEGPDGQKVLVWYSRHYHQTQSMFGLPPSLPAVRDSLPVYLQAYSRPDYKPDVALIFGTQPENTDLVPGTATFAPAWNHEYAYPKLRYATFGEFLKFLDQNYGSQLPTVRGDGGPYWEDGVGSDAAFAAEDRGNQNRALSAEVLSTLAHLVDPSLHAPGALLEDIWRNLLLFSEHTWTAWLSVDKPDHEQTLRQLEVKDHRATLARLEIDELVQRSLSQLSDQIHVPSDTLVVFNSLNWRRNALVEADLLGEKAVLRDLSNGREVPFQILSSQERFLRIRFLAEDLPSVGYKCYAISYPDEAPAPPPAAPSREPVVENTFYRLTLDAASGALQSLYDKELGREVIDLHSPYKFGQYLYVTGGDGATQILHAEKTLPVAKLAIHPGAEGEITSVSKTPFGHSIRLRSHATHTRNIETEILLFDKEKKIEFVYRVEKDPVVAKEGVYFAFPVAAEQPEFVYATQNGLVNPAHDMLMGASLEWFSVQHWMAARDPQLTVGIVPVDAPLASFGDINRGTWPTEFRPPSATLFSYVLNNYWDTNYRAAQGGKFVFRYALTSSRSFDPQALSRLGWEELRPVETNYVMSQDKVGNPQRPLPAEGASFLEIDSPNIVLVNWKLAEDGQGTILRLAEVGGRETTAAMRFLRSSPRAAQLCNAVEDNLNSLSVEGNSLRLSFRPHEVLTVRVQ
jgi:hypothetical protein